MAKIKITKSELDRIIKEEALKFKKAIILKKELANVEKELKQLNEVEAGKDIAPTGGENLSNTKTQFVDVAQKAPKFHNPSKNPHTMMEDDADIEDTEVDIDSDVDSDVDGDTIDKAAVLSAIEDLKMALNLHGVSDESEESEEEESEEETNGEEVGDEDTEFEFDSEEDEEGENGEEESEEEIEEGGYSEEHQNPDTGEVHQTVQKENLEEPIEGGTPVQKADEDDVNDNMKKDTHVKAAGDTLMESEKRRMAILAGIMKG